MKRISPPDVAKSEAVQGWPPKRHFRSLFLSDVHLGAHGCRTHRLLEFLERNDADVIYLVGDFFDNWRRIRSKWSPVHDSVLRTLMERSRAGTRIVYVPGNHDEFFRRHYGIYFDRIEVVEQTFHTAADGKRYLVLHGDCCDVFVNRARWLARLGSHLDGLVRGLNAVVNRTRRALGREEWAAIENALARVNRLIRSRDRFEARLSALARSHSADGVVCGHFHRVALHDDFGVTYANCGDWLESCTAIAEEADGRLRVLEWRDRRAVAVPEEPMPEVEEASGLAV
jgi:UDP-2,3-diacylglucosamine pyrophosphatase LpxH